MRDVFEILENDALIIGKLISSFKRTASSFQVAKRIFKVKGYELKKAEAFMREWFKRWERYGVVKKEVKDGKTYYSFDMNRICFGNGKLKLKIGKFEEEIDLGFVIGVNIKREANSKGKWVIISP